MKRTKWFRVFVVGMVLLTAVGGAELLQHLQVFSAFASPALNGPGLSVNASAGHHAISPDIYGMNTYGLDPNLAKELHIPVQRWGGDGTSRYNWLTDSTNSGFDWYFMGGSDKKTAPGAGADAFIKGTLSTGGKTILTVPMMDYVDKGGAYNCSFPVSKYGAQQSVNPYVHPNGSDCGNSLKANGSQISDTDIALNNIANSPTFQQLWLKHLLSTYGTAAKGGVNIYQMDNEPSGWGNTHRDIHPGSTGYDELVNKTYAYASMVKTTDPSANILGPSDFGWPAYLDSSKAGDNAKSHGDVKFAEYYLQKMHQYEQQHGVRLLNYFDEHYYPVLNGTAEQRLRSTRSLWDPTYKDESWIGQWYSPIQLIPTFHNWVNKDYPGTKIAITEYNWGALDKIDGALAQADVLGIFGRESLDLATLWGTPKPTDPGAYAFRMYRNYDGKGGAYGNTWVQSSSQDQGKLAIYGALRNSDGALTMMVINKTNGALTSNLALAGFNPGAHAQVYTYSGANLKGIVHQADVNATDKGFSASFPAMSMTMLVLPASGGITVPGKPTATPVPPTATATPTQASSDNRWTLTYSDNFTGTKLNSAWGTYDGPHTGGKSYYKPDEITVNNGAHIGVERKTTGGMPITTGGMALFGMAQMYGKYELSVKLPAGKGLDPYAILWPAATAGDVEVDLFESPVANKDKLYFTNHGNGNSSQIIANGNFAAGYHTLTYEWTPGKLHFLVDGVDQGTLTKNVPAMKMWLGIAISSGDAFTGDPDASTKLPASLDVQSVKIYKYNG